MAYGQIKKRLKPGDGVTKYLFESFRWSSMGFVLPVGSSTLSIFPNELLPEWQKAMVLIALLLVATAVSSYVAKEDTNELPWLPVWTLLLSLFVFASTGEINNEAILSPSQGIVLVAAIVWSVNLARLYFGKRLKST